MFNLSNMAGNQLKDYIQHLNRVSDFEKEHSYICQELNDKRVQNEKDLEDLVSIVEEQEEIQKTMELLKNPPESLVNSLNFLIDRESKLRETIGGTKEAVEALEKEERDLHSMFQNNQTLIRDRLREASEQVGSCLLYTSPSPRDS